MDTLECIESLHRINYHNYHIIIVDNGSRNSSVSKILEAIREKAQIALFSKQEIEEGRYDQEIIHKLQAAKSIILIRMDKNYGFAEGNNIAIRFALRIFRPKYILLLNNDVVVDENFLTELVKHMESDRKIGITGPKIYYYNFYGRRDIINFAGEDLIVWKGQGIRYGFNEIDKGQHDLIRNVDKIDGACMLIRSDVFRAIGLLDPDYFAYWEEVDFCYRASKKGYRIVYVPTGKVWHKVASSLGGTLSPIRVAYLTRNMILFVRKNAELYEKIKFMFYFFFFKIWIDSITYLIHNRKAFIYFIKGVKDGLTWRPYHH